MSRVKKSPVVSPEMLRDIDNALRAISDAMPTVQMLEACGQDCTHYRQILQYYDGQLRTVRQAAFPNHPPTE
jgi:hypothetical protein